MTKEYINQLCEMLLKDNLTQNGKRKIANYIEFLQQRIDKSIEYMNSLEFFELMNSKVNTEYCPKDKSQGEDYFKAKEKLVSILQGEEVK